MAPINIKFGIGNKTSSNFKSGTAGRVMFAKNTSFADSSKNAYNLYYDNGTTLDPIEVEIAEAAKKLINTVYIDGMEFNGEDSISKYGVCTTSAGTAAKAATVVSIASPLRTGTTVCIKFSNANTAANPTLNISSTGAKPVVWKGLALASTQYWSANDVVQFVYDGTNWVVIGAIRDNVFHVYGTITSGPNDNLTTFETDYSAQELCTMNNEGYLIMGHLVSDSEHLVLPLVATPSDDADPDAMAIFGGAITDGDNCQSLSAIMMGNQGACFTFDHANKYDLDSHTDDYTNPHKVNVSQLDVFKPSGSNAKQGLVPAPSKTTGATKYLREDGTWTTPPDTDTVYKHPTSSGNKHIPSGGQEGQILRWSADGTATWGADNNSTAGSTDSNKKLFLIGAESQAANPQTYSHDTAYVGTDGCLYSNKTKVSVEGHNHDSRYCAYKTFTFNDGTSTFASAPSGGTSCSASTYNDTLNFVSADGLMSFDAYSDTSGEETVDIYLNVDPAGTAISQANGAESAAKSYADSKDATTLASAQSYADTAVSNLKSALAAGSGLTLNGTTFSHPNSITAGTAAGSSGALSHGGSFTIPKITYNATGHITQVTTTSLTLPAAPTIPTLSKGTDKTGTAVTVTPNASKKATFTAITDTSVSGHTVTDTNTTFTLDLSGFATTGELSSAMVFKGTLGTGGTITSLPSATVDTVGDTYKVITAGTYASIAAKVGDVFVCSSAPAWVLIPSGDEPSGTVTNIATGTGLTGGPITSSGTIAVNMSSTKLGTTGATGTSANTSKVYGVQYDSAGKLAVYVPWTDNNTTYTSLKNPYSLTVQGNGTTSFTYDGSAAKTLNIKAGSNASVTGSADGSVTISVPSATKDIAGVTVVYPEASCTTFTSDSGTCTPLAVQKAAKQFAITRPTTSTDKAITRYSGTTGDVQNSNIIIEDVANTKDTSKTAQVIAIPAEGGKKMVYGYCTDQVDGTSFIGGVFDASATSYPYAAGLAIGGTSGNLLWKGARVLDANTDKYAGSSSAGGAATSANKVNSSLTVKLNGGSTEGTNMFTFNGSAAKSVNITASSIGAAASSHTHDDRYYTETEIDSKISTLNTAINGKAPSSHTHDDRYYTESEVNTKLGSKLDKTTYEYNKELALGSTGKVCIGKFPMYDSNISVEIKSTTNTTYNGTLVIATQNINTSGGGSYTCKVYGDADNSLTGAIKIHYGSGSNVFSVYIDLPAWSKNLLHIQCVSLAGTPTDIATQVSEIPSNATITPTNALKAQLDTKAATSHNHNGVYVKGDYEVKTMSLSAYNALTSKDSKTIYLITS